MRRVPKARAPHTSMPIQTSHTASLTQSSSESGGMVSARRLQGLISGHEGLAIAYFHLRRMKVSLGAAPGSSIVITLFAP
jgi:hypothetical protein